MNGSYTVKEVAEVLGYSTNTIYSFLKEGRLKGVRVGKGRFRIPQEQVNQLLGSTQETQTVQPQAQVPNQLPISIVSNQAQDLPGPTQIPSLPRHLEEVKFTGYPSLFSWFVSLVSIVFGLSLVLFIRHIDEFAVERFSTLLLPIQVIFITAGIGIILAEFLAKKGKYWYIFFNLLLILNYLILTAGFIITGDIEAATIFGLLPIVLVVQFVFSWTGIKSFFLYSWLFITSFPAVLLLFPNSVQGSWSFANITLAGFNSSVIILIWVAVCLVTGIIVWRYKQGRTLFIFIASWTMSLVFLSLAFYYANGLFWARSLFLTILAITAFAAPLWVSYKRPQHNRLTIVNEFIAISLIFLLIVGAIAVMQMNLREHTNEELLRVVTTGQNIIETSLKVSTTAVEDLSQNPLMIKAVQSKDAESMRELSRNVFNSSPYFRRILVINSSGDILNVYPYVILPYANVAFRNYFKQTTQNRQTYITPEFFLQPQ